MPKYVHLADVLEARIEKGDYSVRELPTEVELAREVGISRMTARRAMQKLMDKGVLVRKPHGKLSISLRQDRKTNQLQLAFLSPAFSSPEYEKWRIAVSLAAVDRGAAVRMINFVHWDDPAIPHTLSGFDGVFMIPSSEAVPQFVAERFERAGNLVVLESDYSAMGVPSINLVSPMLVQVLADHLFSLGHRRIACLNTQPHQAEQGPVISERINQWLLWQKIHRIEGLLIDEPVQPYEDPIPQAHAVISRLLGENKFDATALICITDAAVTGALRAFHEHAVKVPADVSVCAPDSGRLARFHVPSRTTVELPDPEPYLAVCMDWFAGKDKWVGPLLIQPSKVPMFTGESTGPCREMPSDLP